MYKHHTSMTQRLGTRDSPAGGVSSWLRIQKMWIAMFQPHRHRADRKSAFFVDIPRDCAGADHPPSSLFSLSSSPFLPHMAESDKGISWPAPN